MSCGRWREVTRGKALKAMRRWKRKSRERSSLGSVGSSRLRAFGCDASRYQLFVKIRLVPQIQKTHRLPESEKKSAGFLNLREITNPEDGEYSLGFSPFLDHTDPSERAEARTTNEGKPVRRRKDVRQSDDARRRGAKATSKSQPASCSRASSRSNPPPCPPPPAASTPSPNPSSVG